MTTAPMTWRDRLKSWARAMKRDATALYFAARDPRVPWFVKVFALAVAAYVLSPIDLIPDFIPVIGYLDELLLLPLAVSIITRLVDPAIMDEHRARASALAERPVSWGGLAIIIAIWVAAAIAVLRLAFPEVWQDLWA